MPKLSNRELLSIIHAHRANSLGSEDSDLSNERAAAMDHYHGRPYGDEQTGRSQVVSRDLSETVEWAVPGIVRTFVHSGNIAEFLPRGPEDEDQADQESDYTNMVIMQDNPGFLILHDAVKECLLLRNAYVKHWWEESQKIRDEEYDGLAIEEVAALMQQLAADGAEVEIVEQEETVIVPADEANGIPGMSTFDVKLRVIEKRGRCMIEAVPVEEVRVSKRCRGSLQDSPFVEHVTRKTRSDLIEMGMDKTFVYDLPALDQDENDAMVLARDSTDDESDSLGGTSIDRSMDEIEYCEAYVRVDYDGDGIAELRKVVTCADQIPPGDEWNEPIDSVPMTGFVAKRVPHRHVGESLDDELSDLQRIKTVLLRQTLDNIYNTVNNQWLVNERVNLQDFLQSLPGGVKRVSGIEPVTGAAEPVLTQSIVDKIFPVIQLIDETKSNRTGIDKATIGLDPDVLKQATKGAFLENINRANQKIEMMARMIAETGVKELVLRVHEILLKHHDKQRMVKLRGKYVPVNPREWKERTDLTVKVGLGVGTEEEKREKLMLLAQMAAQLVGMGLVGPKQAYKLFADIAKTLGEQNPEKYVLDPESPEFQQMMGKKAQSQGGNPLAEAEQIKGQFRMQEKQAEFQLKSQLEQMKMAHEHQMQIMKMQLEAQTKEMDRKSREAIETMKAEIGAMLKGREIDIGAQGIAQGLQE